MLETVIKRDRDLGTPARESTQTVTLTIDGQEVTVPEGSSLMRGRRGRHQHPQALRHRQP